MVLFPCDMLGEAWTLHVFFSVSVRASTHWYTVVVQQDPRTDALTDISVVHWESNVGR